MPWQTVNVPYEVWIPESTGLVEGAPSLAEWLKSGGPVTEYFERFGAPIVPGHYETRYRQQQVWVADPTASSTAEQEASAIVPDGEGFLPGNAPENAIIVRRNTPVDVQNEDRFSPMNGFAFSPLAQNLFSADNGVLAGLLFLIGRKNPKALERLAVKYMDSVSKMLIAITNSGKSHPLTALNASTQFAVVAHRFGVITDSGYLKIADQTRSIIDKLIELNFAGMVFDGLTALVEGSSITSVEKTTSKGTSLTETAKGLGLLADLRSLKP